MSYGIEVSKANGTVLTSQTLPGGRVYVGSIALGTEPVGTQTTYTYENVPGGANLRVLQLDTCVHTWTVGTNAQGQATVTVTAIANRNTLINSTYLLIFATQTQEPSYGIDITNDAGERTVSSIYPCPEFLGKITFTDVTPIVQNTGEGGYYSYQYAKLTNLGSGRTRLILWNLPETTADCWFTGDSIIRSDVTGNYYVSGYYLKQQTVASQEPEAFIFALDGLTESTDTYGLRIYDASTPQKLLFDAGLEHMIIKGYENTVDYPTVTGTVYTYTNLNTMSNTPVFLVPAYSRETWLYNSKLDTSTGNAYRGVMRRSGNTLYTKLIRNRLFSDENPDFGTFYYGLNTDLVQVVVDGARYGATPTGLMLTTSRVSGTQACSFDGLGTNFVYTCTSTSSWKTTVTGGNGNSLRYYWTFESNPGGLTMTNTESDTCTLTKTASAGTSSSITYTAVIRCTVTQSGSITQYVDITVVHTHTDTYVPYNYQYEVGGYGF